MFAIIAPMKRPTVTIAVGTGLAVLLLGLAVASGSVRDPIEGAADSLGSSALPLVAAIAFLETSIPPVTLLFPGEWIVAFAGAMAGRGTVPIAPLVLVVWACSAAGDSVGFLLGRRFGRGWLLRHGARLGLTGARLARVDDWFDRYGSAAVALGRLVPLVRPIGPFAAGSTTLPYRRFLPWDLVGTALFSLAFCMLGYFFYRGYESLVAAVDRGGLAALAAVIVAALVATILRRRRRAA